MPSGTLAGVYEWGSTGKGSDSMCRALLQDCEAGGIGTYPKRAQVHDTGVYRRLW